ncbi:MAG: hypothetical protein GC190_19220 [Alphaproteobacteria bacterium]|nr:hypothetical protein [Alphaproteobacteria bacterium]
MTSQKDEFEPAPPAAQPDFYKPIEDHDEGVVEGQLAVVHAAEITQQIATARRYPRIITHFRRRVYEHVTVTTEVAESCIYTLERKGRDNRKNLITGPSIRFAEVLQNNWGNCRSSTEVLGHDDEYITAEAVFFDLETNSATRAQIMRRITNSKGQVYSADMIQMTGNAAASIALRNVILRGVPRALWQELFDEVQKVAAGSAHTFVARRDKTILEFEPYGVTDKMIFDLLGIAGLDDMKSDHIMHLRGILNAVRDGQQGIDATFDFASRSGANGGQVTPPRPQRGGAFRRAEGGAPERAAAAAKPTDTAPATAAAEHPAQTQAQGADKAAQAPASVKAEPSAPEGTGKGAAQDGTGGAPAQEEKPTGQSAEKQPATPEPRTNSDLFNEWYADRCAELKTITSIRELSDLRNDTVNELGDDPRAAEFSQLCDDRSREIISAGRAQRASKQK